MLPKRIVSHFSHFRLILKPLQKRQFHITQWSLLETFYVYTYNTEKENKAHFLDHLFNAFGFAHFKRSKGGVEEKLRERATARNAQD